jgi:rubrerythrin
MIELNDFYNAGFGWICRHCSRNSKTHEDETPRLLREGEAESRAPRLSTDALAKWTDPARTRLVCPQCGITEPVERS